MNLPAEFISAPKGEYKDVAFSGELIVKGEAQPAAGTATVVRDGPGVKVDAKFGMKITQYPIAVPKYLGITVAEDVQLEVTVVADQVIGKTELRTAQGKINKSLTNER